MSKIFSFSYVKDPNHYGIVFFRLSFDSIVKRRNIATVAPPTCYPASMHALRILKYFLRIINEYFLNIRMINECQIDMNHKLYKVKFSNERINSTIISKIVSASNEDKMPQGLSGKSGRLFSRI